MKPWVSLIFRGLTVEDKSAKQLQRKVTGIRREARREDGVTEKPEVLPHGVTASVDQTSALGLAKRDQPVGVAAQVGCKVGASFRILRCQGSQPWCLGGGDIDGSILFLLIWGVLGERNGEQWPRRPLGAVRPR